MIGLTQHKVQVCHFSNITIEISIWNDTSTPVKSYNSWSVWRPTSQKPLDINWCFKNAKHVPLSHVIPLRRRNVHLKLFSVHWFQREPRCYVDNRLKPYFFRRLFFTFLIGTKSSHLSARFYIHFLRISKKEKKKSSLLICWLTKILFRFYMDTL